MKTRIILVDDEESMHTIFKMKFKKEIRAEEVIIESYMNGKECADSLLSQDHEEIKDITVIFSDINMPQMNGYKLLEKLKERFDQTPIVMITAYADPQTLDKVKNMGAYSLIPKPVDFDQLKEILAKIKQEYN